ncbi:MAG: 3-deoxy-7-phosphoheptulonate synthase [Candidatus Eisenbacteria bacterium]|nr:3-deoxy-7-phosphoheptulonate synthase [Candidatus Eisenbacteria bacterium]
MIIRVKKGATEAEIAEVVRRIEANGLKPDASQGVDRLVIGVIGDTRKVGEDLFLELEAVESVHRITRPYKLVSREFRSATRRVKLGDLTLGDGSVAIVAGPCSVEGRDMILTLADEVKAAGAQALRGGAYKPRTSPYAFQGLGGEGLRYLAEARQRTGLPVVTEATGTNRHPREDGSIEDERILDQVVAQSDVIQIGARNMKSYGLLEECARLSGPLGKPVLLKRGESATIEEFLLAAEYLAAYGNEEIILCLRGVRTFESKDYQRYSSDIAAIPILKRQSNLPVFFDPSHATGDRHLVRPLALAAVAAGADGLLLETHSDPQKAWSDGQQCITPSELERIVKDVRKLEAVRGE